MPGPGRRDLQVLVRPAHGQAGYSRHPDLHCRLPLRLLEPGRPDVPKMNRGAAPRPMTKSPVLELARTPAKVVITLDKSTVLDIPADITIFTALDWFLQVKTEVAGQPSFAL